MKRQSIRRRFMKFAMATAVGGSVFALNGCDPGVRETVLTGLEATTQGLTNTLVSAFFQSLANTAPEDTQNSLTTVTTP